MTAAAIRPPLVRPRDAVLGGVSVALAQHLRISPVVVRVVFAVTAVAGVLFATYAIWMVGNPLLALSGAAFGLLYLWLWALSPREAGTPDAPRTRVVPVAAVLLGASAVSALLVLVTWGLQTPLPIGAVESAALAVLSISWTVVADARDPKRAASAPQVRVLAAGVLILLGLLLLPGTFTAARPLVAVLSVVLVLLGIAALIVPPLIVRLTARGAERAARAREEQRSEIAAHLHDSVLQTLAIIQNRAGTGSEIARIARAQERELRDWLFAGTDPFAGDLATELRTMSRDLELEHAVRIEVVTVGDVGDLESAALAGAAREALVNAARHAGGDVTVYAEATPEAVEVFVRDRGDGFDADAIPDGRLGIRESIVGRMTRAGGTAVVVSSPDGTEVQLRLPRRATTASGAAHSTAGGAS